MLKKLAAIFLIVCVFAVFSLWRQSSNLSATVQGDHAAIQLGMDVAQMFSVARRWFIASAESAHEAGEPGLDLAFLNTGDSVEAGNFTPPAGLKWDAFIQEVGRRRNELAPYETWLFTYKAASTPAKASFTVKFKDGKIVEVSAIRHWD